MLSFCPLVEIIPYVITVAEIQRLFIAARVATAQQQYSRAATLFGLAEQAHSQVHNAIGGPMRALADAALATVREALDPALFAEVFATGQQMALAEAFAAILATSQAVGALVELGYTTVGENSLTHSTKTTSKRDQ